jgi:cytochrome c-type biogenesis protein
MVDSALLATVTLAFSAGVATFFAPCAYPLLPGYVGYYVSVATDDENEEDNEDQEVELPVTGAVFRGLAASLGMLIVFALVAVITFTVGQSLIRNITYLEPVIGVFLIVLGVVTVAGYAPEFTVRLPERRANIAGFAGFGAIYAIAATGCTAPIFLALIAQSLTFSTMGASAVIFAYAIGMALLMLFITVLIAVGYDAVSGAVSQHLESITKIGGVIMILAGIGQLYYSIFILEVI